MGSVEKMGELSVEGMVYYRCLQWNSKRGINKVGCAFLVDGVSILLQAKFGPNDHREETPHFTPRYFRILEKFLFILASMIK